VRHLQHAQLQKVHGEEYVAAHQLYQQRREQGGSPATAGSSNGRTTARRLQAIKAAAQPSTRLQKLLQENQASTLRIQPVYQLEGGSLSAQQAAQVKDVLVPGAIKVLQQYVKVGPGWWLHSGRQAAAASKQASSGGATSPRKPARSSNSNVDSLSGHQAPDRAFRVCLQPGS
jgi:hypothetical protein